MLQGWLLGLLLGMRHALDPDHLAAISTLVAEQRSSRAAALLGAFWGAGHALTLSIFASALLVMKAAMPPRLGDACELAVAVMLILLGIRGIYQAVRAGRDGDETLHRHAHGVLHSHGGVDDHVHLGSWTMARRPLLIGIVHGLAGSGALTAIILAQAPDLATGLAQILVFAFGTLVGMALLTGLAGWPVAKIAARPRLRHLLVGSAGAASLFLGAWFGWPLTVRLLGG